VALYQHAWRLREALALSPEERVELLVARNCWLVAPGTSLLSLVLAWGVTPTAGWMAGLPGMAYALMWCRQPVARATRRRAMAGIAAAA
jgi:hypothetical protein